MIKELSRPESLWETWEHVQCVRKRFITLKLLLPLRRRGRTWRGRNRENKKKRSKEEEQRRQDVKISCWHLIVYCQFAIMTCCVPSVLISPERSLPLLFRWSLRWIAAPTSWFWTSWSTRRGTASKPSLWSACRGRAALAAPWSVSPPSDRTGTTRVIRPRASLLHLAVHVCTCVTGQCQ